MNGRVAASIAAGVAGLGTAAGVHMVMRGAAERTEDAARAEWNDWKQQLDREFPKGGAGDDLRRPPARRRRRAALRRVHRRHPAPTWLNVKHENLRAVSIDPFEPDPAGNDWTGLSAAALGIGGGMAVGFTGAMMLGRAGSTGTTVGLALNVAGAALSLGTIASLFLLPDSRVYDDVKAGEWNVPTHWTE